MPYIKTVSETDAQGAVKRIYDGSLKASGRIPHIVRLLSPDAPVMQASMGIYMSLMKRKNALKPSRREMIATVVSNANDCYY